MLRVGVVGGIGSGKSSVCTLLESMGYPVFYADIESKRLCDTSPDLRTALIDAFGTHIYSDTGILNRPVFASIIFNNPQQLKLANEIIHPEVRDEYLRWVSKQTTRISFIESAILLQGIFYSEIDKIVLVRAPEQERVQRAMKRGNISEQVVFERIKNQLTEEQMKEKAHFIINNDENELIIPQIELLVKELTEI